MTAPLLAVTVALILSLPIFILGERLREREERRRSNRCPYLPERTNHE